MTALTLKNLLFIHSWSGCDTTSATFGQGKGLLLKKMSPSQELQELSQLFYKNEANHVEIRQVGLRIFVILYGGKLDDNLTKLRYAHYMNLVATLKQQIRPEKLPPTQSAAEYHSYRVYLQVVLWNTLMGTQVSPLEWGWKEGNGMYKPIALTKDPAPPEILNVI